MLIEKLVGMHKLKYDELSNMVANNFEEGKFINIFINLQSILDYFYIPTTVQKMQLDFDKSNKFTLSKCILNMAAHYRHFFFSRYKVSSKIYFYYSDNVPTYNRNINSLYKKNLFNKKDLFNEKYFTLNNYIKKELSIFKDILNYIYDIYLIDSENVDTTIIPYHFIKKSGNDFCNLLITKDELEYQYVKFAKTYILNIKKDNNTMVTKKNVYSLLLEKNKAKFDLDVNISETFIPLILSISGVKKFNIDGVSGYGFIKTIKKLASLIKEEKIMNECIYIDRVISSILSDTYDDSQKVLRNMKTIDVEIMYEDFKMKRSSEIKIENQLVNKYDKISIDKVNSKYFNNELMLGELMEGVYYTINEMKRTILI